MLVTRELTRPLPGQFRPACPNCGRPMHITRVTPATEDLAELRTYSCGECGVGLTEAAGDRAVAK